MFGFLQSENSKLRDAAKNWLYLGRKVYNYRKDKLTDAELGGLDRRMNELDYELKAKPANAGKLKLAIEGVEAHMRKVGGAFYPQSMFSENVDFVLSFLIIFIGFTAFFIKQFEIPTNSMWPTFHGMTGEVWTDENEAPNGFERLIRYAAKGASRYDMVAPKSGELLIPLLVNGGRVSGLAKSTVSKRHHLVIPGKGVGYIFEIGGEQVVLKVPNDFHLEIPMPIGGSQSASILGTSWFPEESSFFDVIQKQINARQVDRRDRMNLGDGSSAEVIWVKSGLFFSEGDKLLSFDIHSGDRLLVDRMSYHFVRPKVGDGFVFLTGGIDNLSSTEEQFYIKRLSGTPGDRLKFEDGKLFVNDEEATGSVAFGRNNRKEAPYDGYFDEIEQTAPGFQGLLRPGEEILVPEDSYVALGDNSANSYDSRGWGYVPLEAPIVGRPIMIFYPFTKRFGISE